jgi:hypothetical protein
MAALPDGFYLQVVSDVMRNGMALELVEHGGAIRADVFRCDEDRSITLTIFEHVVPVPDDVLDALIDAAQKELDPFEDGTPIGVIPRPPKSAPF